MQRNHRSILTSSAFLAMTALACVGLAPEDYEAASREVSAEMLEIDFSSRPSYLDPNVIVLTFDDGPDPMYTPMVLDILRDKGVRATFFINTDNQSKVMSDAMAQELLKRMVAEGHELATHTVHHLDLTELTEARIEEEIVGVENTVRDVFGEGGPAMTLLRAPFGRPYQSAAGSAAYQKVSSVVSRYAVHVGWAIDSNDWRYQGDADQVYNHVTGLIKQPGQGAYGVILLHSINPQTVGALPRLIDYMRTNGFVFKSTEDVVRARFGGLSSAQLLKRSPAPTGGNGSGGTAGSSGSQGGGGSGGSAEPDAGGGASDSGSAIGGKAGSNGQGSNGPGGGSAGGATAGGGRGPQDRPSSSAVTGGCALVKDASPSRVPAPLLLLCFAALALLLRRR